MCIGCTKAAPPGRTGFRGFVVWEAGSEFCDLPGWLCLLLFRAQSTVLSSVPKHPLLGHQTAFLLFCEMENGISKVSGAEKQWMAPVSPFLVTMSGGTAGVCTLHIRPWCTRSCSPFSQGLLSYWVVLCDICKHFWHSVALANSFGVVDFCNALSEILPAELSDMSLWCLLQIPWNVNISEQLPLRNLLYSGKKGNNYSKYTVL